MQATPINLSMAQKIHLKKYIQLVLPVILSLFLALGVVGPVSASLELQSVEDGAEVDLKSLIGNGKWTLVMLWAVDCHICHEQKPEISRFHNEHKDIDAHVVGISLDGVSNVDRVTDYIAKNDVSFPNYVGNVAIIASNYFAMTEESFRGTPTYLLFNPEGELLGNNPGPLRVKAIEEFIARNDSKTE